MSKNIEKGTIYRDKLLEGRKSPIRTYIALTAGEVNFAGFLFYEIITFFLGPLPGCIGIFLRKIFYPYLFKKTGKGLIIGRNVVIRHPNSIILGDNVTIDDNCLLDARGAGPEGLVLGNEVIINRNCMIQAKNGPIHIGRRTSIGCNSVIVSLDGIFFGESVLTAGGIYVSAGAYNFDNLNLAIMDQKAYTKGPIHIGANSWLGTCAIILDGINIGSGSVIGAGSVVNKDIPNNAVAVGVPAKVIKNHHST